MLIFFSILNAFLSLFSLHVLNKYNIDDKLKFYTKLIRINKYYENNSIIFYLCWNRYSINFTLIIQLNTPTNIAVINQIDNENFVKIFRKGELIFEYKEIKVSDIKFIRTIQDQRFTFENNKLISTEILSRNSYTFIYPLYEDTNSVKSNNPPFTRWGIYSSIKFLIKDVVKHDYYENEILIKINS